ncbi:MAG: NnrS family protein [Pseudomonadota bacterium]
MTLTLRPPFADTFLSAGFRPFFLSAGVWAVVSMAIWIAVVTGLVSMADPFAWHVHELVFGYVGAAIAGFLLTAAPSWTKRSALRGQALAGLWAAWVAARIAMLGFGSLPALPLALLDLLMPIVLFGIVLSQIVASKNWRNVSVVIALLFYIIGNVIFHWEAMLGFAAASGYGARLGIASVVMLVSIVGGRIAPNFTRNWLKRRGETRLPPPASRYDIVCHVLLASSLILWVLVPFATLSGLALMAASGAHFWRMRGWRSLATRSDPLLWVLHAGYAFVPLGAFAIGMAIVFPLALAPGAMIHLWTIGALAVTTLAVMTRASLAHSGAALVALPGSTLLYLCLIAAAFLRPVSGLFPGISMPLQSLAGLLWIVAFGGFVVLYRGTFVRNTEA